MGYQSGKLRHRKAKITPLIIFFIANGGMAPSRENNYITNYDFLAGYYAGSI